ncbi:MAG: metallophosphoesterase [Actinomycetota bacterium]|nr:metallophosphoesterase [Actinomycetota bacterium]
MSPARPHHRSSITLGFVLAFFIWLAVSPQPAPAFKVAAAGDVSCPRDVTDSHEGEWIEPGRSLAQMKCQARPVGDMIAAEEPFFTIAAGDLIQGQNAVASAYRDFDWAWAPLGEAIMPTLGNHDQQRNPEGPRTADGYFDYWEGQGARPWKIGHREEGWSSWNAGTWHMINLNSNCHVADCTLTGPQLRWLVNDLKEDRKNPETKCTMAYFHHPLFSSGSARGRSGDKMLVSNFWELLYRYRADIVVTGHQHFYERYLPQNPSGKYDPTGITQFITGTGGASTFHPEGKQRRPAVNSASSVRALGATFFQLGSSGFRWQFKTVTGKVRDKAQERVDCHDRNEGQVQRKVRAERYTARMGRLRELKRKAVRVSTRIRRMKRRDAAPARIRKAKVRLAKVRTARVRLTYKPLYR